RAARQRTVDPRDFQYARAAAASSSDARPRNATDRHGRKATGIGCDHRQRGTGATTGAVKALGTQALDSAPSRRACPTARMTLSEDSPGPFTHRRLRRAASPARTRRSHPARRKPHSAVSKHMLSVEVHPELVAAEVHPLARVVDELQFRWINAEKRDVRGRR